MRDIETLTEKEKEEIIGKMYAVAQAELKSIEKVAQEYDVSPAELFEIQVDAYVDAIMKTRLDEIAEALGYRKIEDDEEALH